MKEKGRKEGREVGRGKGERKKGTMEGGREERTGVGGKDLEKREHIGPVGRNVTWYSHYRKQRDGSSKN